MAPAVLAAGVVLAPETLLGSMATGAVLAGGNNVAVQVIATGKVNPTEAAVNTVAGAVLGGVGYGVAVEIGNAVNGAAVAAEQKAINAARIENNVGRDGGVDPYAPVPNAQSQTNLSDKALVDAANGTNNPHYDPKHGASTSLQQQYDRAMNGTNPQTGAAGRPADASKFFNATDMETAITQAEAAYAANPSAYTRPNGQVNVGIDFSRPIGEGYVGDTAPNRRTAMPIGEYRWSNTATVGIDPATGKAYTAFPNVSVGVAKPDPLKNGVQR